MAAPYLRSETDGRFTTTGAEWTVEQYDDQQIWIHDQIDALGALIAASTGAVAHSVQVMTGSDTWDGVSPLVYMANASAAPVTVTIPTASIALGNVVEIIDVSGNANTYNITIVGEGSENINGVDTGYVVATNYRRTKIVCTATEMVAG